MKKKLLVIVMALMLLGGTIAFAADICGCGCGHPVIAGETHCGCGWTPEDKG